jgi:CheY-like chemotaxis protein
MAPGDKGFRILVVDDEPLVCDSVKRLLVSDGHQVEATTSAMEALSLVEKNRFDLVIVDYEMPVMSGDKLAAAIKARVPDQPIIMITAYPETIARSRVPLEGVDAVVNKPFPVGEMRQAIANLLRGH